MVVGKGPRITSVSTPDDLSYVSTGDHLGGILGPSGTAISPHQELFQQALQILWTYRGRPVRDLQLGVWKFNQYFNILPGMEPAYREFLETEFIPVMERLGIKVTNIWKAIIGSGPFILVEGTSPKIEEIAKTIAMPEYRSLTRTLKSRYVSDYQSRRPAPTRRVEVPYFVKGLTAGL